MSLTDEQIRIAIAEWCGFKPGIERETPFRKVWWKDGGCFCDCDIPDYMHDLNAMHEAEETLNGEERDAYANLIINPTNGPHWRFNCIHTPTTQRARAFLKVKGVEL